MGTGRQGTQGEAPREHGQASPPNHRRLWYNPGPHTYTHTGSSAWLEARPILGRTCPGWPRPRDRMESFSPLDNETKIICCFNYPHDSQHNGQGHGVVKTNARGAALGRSTASPHARGKVLEINQPEQINLTQSPTLEESVPIGPPVSPVPQQRCASCFTVTAIFTKFMYKSSTLLTRRKGSMLWSRTSSKHTRSANQPQTAHPFLGHGLHDKWKDRADADAQKWRCVLLSFSALASLWKDI